MRKTGIGFLVSGMLFLLPATAGAVDGKFGLRANVGYGNYNGELTLPPLSAEDNADSTTAGLGANFIFLPARKFGLFVDLGLDYYHVSDGLALYSDFVRTDMTFTFGARIINMLSPFIGLRQAWQDTSTIFDDDIWTEDGTYIGLGVGLIPLGKRVGLSGSVAYNLNEVDVAGPGTTKFDYDGYSGKLRLSVGNHGVEVRYQNFEREISPAWPIGLEETYVYLVYVLNIPIVDF